jgi:integration host factor subunit beta
MVKAMKESQRIEIRGFGSFMMRSYKPYTGRNPKSGERIKVKSKKLPFFKTGKDMRDRVNIK